MITPATGNTHNNMIQSSAVITRYNISAVITRYNVVQYSKILHKWLQELRQNITQMVNPQKKDTPYLALTGKLWGVFCEHFLENWPRYNGIALYIITYCWWARKTIKYSQELTCCLSLQSHVKSIYVISPAFPGKFSISGATHVYIGVWTFPNRGHFIAMEITGSPCIFLYVWQF